MAEVKKYKSDVGSDSNLELEKGIWIIDLELSATISTTKIQSSKLDEPEEVEHLFNL